MGTWVGVVIVLLLLLWRWQILREAPHLATCSDPSGQTMLHLACIFNLTDIALVLIAAGANPDSANSFGGLTAWDSS